MISIARIRLQDKRRKVLTIVRVSLLVVCLAIGYFIGLVKVDTAYNEGYDDAIQYVAECDARSESLELKKKGGK